MTAEQSSAHRSLRVMRAGAAAGWTVGVWLGLLDGAFALRGGALPLGSLVDRLGTLALALLLAASAAALAGAGAALLLSLLLRRHADGPAGAGERASGRSGGPIPFTLLASLTRAAPHAQQAAVASTGVATAFALAAAFVAGRETPVPTPSAGARIRPNIVLVSIDTLRADHLTPYGYSRDTSPVLARFAASGVLFERAYASSNWTLPSHATLFTGLDPWAHGVLESDDRLAGAHRTIAERLREEGYWTGAWVGTPAAGYVGARYGFRQGFHAYRHSPHPRRFHGSFLALRLDRLRFRFLDRELGNARAQTDSVMAWLRSRPAEPFFLFLHFYDVHSRFAGLPYEAPAPFFDRFCPGEIAGFSGCREGRCASDLLVDMVDRKTPPFDPRELERVRCLYDGAIAFVDAEIGRILQALEDEGLADETVVIVTADHGEAFFEHGHPMHSTLHEEAVRVPLIVRVPGHAGGHRVSRPVRLADVMPTVLELAGAVVPEVVQGRSLAAELDVEGVPAPRPPADVLAVGQVVRSTMLLRGDRKYIEYDAAKPGARPRAELFDLAADEHERQNRVRAEPELRRSLRRDLSHARRAGDELRARILGGETPAPVEMNEAERARLRALGYAQ